jgi:S1-C subfamily serine protease
MIRLAKVIFILAYLFVFVGDARDFSYADSVMYLGTESAASNMMKVVFAVHFPGNQTNDTKADDWKSAGTGFFVSGTNGVLIGITCLHVIAPAPTHVFVGVDTEVGYQRYPANVAYVDATNDIAILLPQRAKEITNTVQNLWFGLDMFGDEKTLVEGRGVLITGYPLSLGTEDDKNHPVVRHGMIAQNSGAKFFLIDGVASPGNSGSPVFTLNYQGNKLAGMVTSYVSDKISLFDQNGNLTAQFPYNSGLARAVRADVIAQAIEVVNTMLSRK